VKQKERKDKKRALLSDLYSWFEQHFERITALGGGCSSVSCFLCVWQGE
jgi:hypothetical protein